MACHVPARDGADRGVTRRFSAVLSRRTADVPRRRKPLMRSCEATSSLQWTCMAICVTTTSSAHRALTTITWCRGVVVSWCRGVVVSRCRGVAASRRRGVVAS